MAMAGSQANTHKLQRNLIVCAGASPRAESAQDRPRAHASPPMHNPDTITDAHGHPPLSSSVAIRATADHAMSDRNPALMS